MPVSPSPLAPSRPLLSHFSSTFEMPYLCERSTGPLDFQSHVILRRQNTRRISRVPLGEEIERFSSWFDGAQLGQGFLFEGTGLKTCFD